MAMREMDSRECLTVLNGTGAHPRMGLISAAGRPQALAPCAVLADGDVTARTDCMHGSPHLATGQSVTVTFTDRDPSAGVSWTVVAQGVAQGVAQSRLGENGQIRSQRELPSNEIWIVVTRMSGLWITEPPESAVGPAADVPAAVQRPVNVA